MIELEPGSPYPLGATRTDRGVNFAVFSDKATRIHVCIHEADGGNEIARHELTEYTDGVFHGLLPGAGSGLTYGLRAEGPSDPERGLRFNPRKLLLDPYARKIVGRFQWADAHLDNGPNSALDNARYMVKAVVPDAAEEQFDWQGVESPRTPLDRSVLYEVHVKGFTARHPEVPEPLRGTYEGFASPAPLRHLKRLGITAVSLLPVHQAISERGLVDRGLVNYWGYNTLGFFLPERRYARANPIIEFKTMVRELHRAGIEVILDVVYNHTCEGDQRGPTLSFRGLDNPAYYHLRQGMPAHYENFTGTGNAVDVSHPRVMQLVLDSLRYWVTEMRVDGFRFDLATTLARESRGLPGDGSYNADAAFFQAVRQDPVLSRVKLIAEPWDVGMGGYQVGRFPSGWSEWNDRYRDSTRAFWISKATYRGELASRLTGTSDLFDHDGRRPQSSINFVTAHDGFTLHDLVSYNQKHNDANGEDNRDGTSDNRSWNCGVEGPTDLLAVNATRRRLKRAMLATLLVSQGTPMLLGGDEMGRTQQGNNNAYCQDGPVSWFDWSTADEDLIDFTAWMIDIRQRFAQLRSRHWLRGGETAVGRIAARWLNRRGDDMTAQQWDKADRHVLGLVLGARNRDEHDLLLLFNAENADWAMKLPAGQWQAIVDTGQRNGRAPEAGPVSGERLLKARSVTLLQQTGRAPD